MLNTSSDFLRIVIAVDVTAITVFLCLALFHLSGLLKHSKEIVLEVQERLAEIGEAVTEVKDKLKTSVNYLSAISTAVNGVMSFVKTKKKK